MTPCSLVDTYQRSGGTSCLHLQCIRSRWFARYVGTRHQIPKRSVTSRLCTRAPNPDTVFTVPVCTLSPVVSPSLFLMLFPHCYQPLTARDHTMPIPAAARVLGFRVRIPPGYVDVCLLYIVRWKSLSSRGFLQRGAYMCDTDTSTGRSRPE